LDHASIFPGNVSILLTGATGYAYHSVLFRGMLERIARRAASGS
jgi:hypothetical protein